MIAKNINLSKIDFYDLKKYPIVYRGIKTRNYAMKLVEFFKEYSDDFIVYLDTKTDGEKTKFENANKLVGILKKYNILNKVIVANADFIFLAYIEYNYPEVITALEGF